MQLMCALNWAYPLFDGVVSLFCNLRNYSEGRCRIVKVLPVWIQVFQVVFQEQAVLREPLDRFEHVVLNPEIFAAVFDLEIGHLVSVL